LYGRAFTEVPSLEVTPASRVSAAVRLPRQAQRVNHGLIFIKRKKIKRGAGLAAAKNFKISTTKLVQTRIIQRHQ